MTLEYIQRVFSKIYNRSPHRGTNIYTASRRLEILEMVELKQEVSVSRVTFSRPRFHTDSFYFLPLSFFLCSRPRFSATPFLFPACAGRTHPLDFTTRPRLGFILILKETSPCLHARFFPENHDSLKDHTNSV